MGVLVAVRDDVTVRDGVNVCEVREGVSVFDAVVVLVPVRVAVSGYG